MINKINYHDKIISEYMWTSNALIHEHNASINVKNITDIKRVINMNLDKKLNARLKVALILISRSKSRSSRSGR